MIVNSRNKDEIRWSSNSDRLGLVPLRGVLDGVLPVRVVYEDSFDHADAGWESEYHVKLLKQRLPAQGAEEAGDVDGRGSWKGK